jgi:DNA invertase Pin-like site-specific DNA recombinase
MCRVLRVISCCWAASKRRFDVVMAWAIDRLGRSLIGLLGTIEHLEAASVDLHLEQQNIDTTSPTGMLLFQVTGAFAEFERGMIRQRIDAGLRTIKPRSRAARSSPSRTASSASGSAALARRRRARAW